MRKRITPETVWDVVSAGGLAASPDGRRALYQRVSADRDSQAYTKTYALYDPAAGTSQALPATEGSYFFSSDSQLMRAVQRDGATDIVLSEGSRDGELLCTIPFAADSLAPMSGGRFVCAVTDGGEDCPFPSSRYPFWLEGETGFLGSARKRLVLYDSRTACSTDITAEAMAAEACSAVGDLIVYYGASLTPDGAPDPTVAPAYLYDAACGVKTRITPDGFVTVGAVIADGNTVVLAGSDCEEALRNAFPEVYCYRIDSGTFLPLTSGIMAEIGQTVILDYAVCQKATPLSYRDGAVYFLAVKDNTKALFSLDPGGTLRQLSGDACCVLDFCVLRNAVLVNAVTGNRAEELYLLEDGAMERVTCLNAWADDCYMPAHRRFSRRNALGSVTDGFLLEPLGFDPSQRYPLALHIHGGPNCIFSNVFGLMDACLAGAGYFVLFLNPPGSSGKGSNYADICGKWGAADYECLMDFVDAAIGMYPQIDPGRLGVFGGSYGGFMVNWIVGHTDRFRAAVSERGISNWVSFALLSDIGLWFAPAQLGADTWQEHDLLWDASPLKYSARVRTPILFLHGADDHRCPCEESLQMYGAVKLTGTETAFRIFDGCNHGLTASGPPASRQAYFSCILRWFDDHLTEAPSPQ